MLPILQRFLIQKASFEQNQFDACAINEFTVRVPDNVGKVKNLLENGLNGSEKKIH